MAKTQRGVVVDEDDITVLCEKDVSTGLEACQHSLVGKVISERQVPLGVFRNVKQAVWGEPEGVKIIEFAPRIFHIFFSIEADLRRVLRSPPWIFKNSFLLLRR
ncbi:hypothetical protein L6164_028382 [Bauhinia variegata]|uniref:Uncharacterized protein n=1 Tax=Bauhinia variegata TaxID=167791 RepID=A0ACB9L581_BAUVA|nr:hypothetical protein L6164_028382 [Bauhinia variegata]